MRRETQNCFYNAPHDLKYKATRGNLERNVSLASYSETDTVETLCAIVSKGNLRVLSDVRCFLLHRGRLLTSLSVNASDNTTKSNSKQTQNH